MSVQPPPPYPLTGRIPANLSVVTWKKLSRTEMSSRVISQVSEALMLLRHLILATNCHNLWPSSLTRSSSIESSRTAQSITSELYSIIAWCQKDQSVPERSLFVYAYIRNKRSTHFWAIIKPPHQLSVQGWEGHIGVFLLEFIALIILCARQTNISIWPTECFLYKAD